MDKLIRLKGSDKVFLVKSTKHWLKTADTLTGLGFNFGDEVEVTAEEFANYEEGEPIEIQESELSDGSGVVKEFTEQSKEPDNDIAEPVKELWQ